MRKIVLALLCVLAAARAEASVIYNWSQIGGSGVTTGQIEMTDAAFASGRVQWSVVNPSFDPYEPAVGPITRFDFNANDIRLGSSDDFIGYFDFDLTIVGNKLVGSIFANNTFSQIRLESLFPTEPTSWLTSDAATDQPGVCQDGSCGGAIGRWLLSGAPADVIEPASAGVLGLGLLGLVVTRRRKAKRPLC